MFLQNIFRRPLGPGKPARPPWGHCMMFQSRDQVGCYPSLQEDKIQGSPQTTVRHADIGGWLASPGFLDFCLPGGCGSSRLDHGFEISRNPRGRPSGRLIANSRTPPGGIAKDIIACGFDKNKTFLFSDLEYVGHM